MKSVYNTLAGKWFIDNINNLSTESIPSRVLTSLSNFTDEGLYILADEMVWKKIFSMFEEHKGVDLSSENQDDSPIFLEEQELDDFINAYKQENFATFKSCEELIDFFVCKMEFMLELTVAWSQNCIKLREHLDYWQFIEDKARYHHIRGKRAKAHKTLSPQNCAKIIGDTKPYSALIKAKLQEKDYEGASSLVKEFKTFLERKQGGAESPE